MLYSQLGLFRANCKLLAFIKFPTLVARFLSRPPPGSRLRKNLPRGAIVLVGILPQYILPDAFVIAVVQSVVQISLQRVDAIVKRLAERNLIELQQYRLVKPLTTSRGSAAQYPAGQWMPLWGPWPC